MNIRDLAKKMKLKFEEILTKMKPTQQR